MAGHPFCEGALKPYSSSISFTCVGKARQIYTPYLHFFKILTYINVMHISLHIMHPPTVYSPL